MPWLDITHNPVFRVVLCPMKVKSTDTSCPSEMNIA